jgi:hypothetical protein
VNVFTKGWTNASVADDFLARWVSPIDARFVRIQAVPGPINNPHDRNVQIDAIIASMNVATYIPEPNTFALLLVGVAAVAARRVRRRT